MRDEAVIRVVGKLYKEIAMDAIIGTGKISKREFNIVAEREQVNSHE